MPHREPEPPTILPPPDPDPTETPFLDPPPWTPSGKPEHLPDGDPATPDVPPLPQPAI